ncbi:hypothetical protein TWF225_005811 [Orbilia oligospora]|uniref:Uncharacterized protein n=1 Tax=Orbilia oligospora TaxID=2813651 RepID=A0A7C8KGX5_ORBOL|nr:hypothetical protein TWF751_005117 [Orbilia oligospora]KAF3184903.1 hypothetical protein TWF225_005811 [Orbilia oligospora]KAF3271261.1 hypothetical protein TWF217_005663 [Orbilia oligospora]KAF3271813.1 hypothetical protein TWF128_000348 [Orbilia oligospora]KAF3271814.1 hypothetical protein TWF128_000348 [Orbilia oligospora]
MPAPRRRRASPPPPTHTPGHHHIPAPPSELLPWYFYLAPHPLDDPLAPLPLPTAGATQARYPPRPFSVHDSEALEKAYQALLVEKETKKPPTPINPISTSSTSAPTDTRPGRRRRSDPRKSQEYTSSPLRTSDVPPEMSEEGAPLPPVSIPARNGQVLLADDFPTTAMERREVKKQNRNSISSITSQLAAFTPSASPSLGSYSNSAGTTSNPFIRAKSRGEVPPLRKSSKPRSSESRHGSKDRKSTRPPTTEGKDGKDEKLVPVGIQRLHQVRIPSLNMEPIYWSPRDGLDNAKVIRGTWFYKDTMFPVETEKANALEKGWREVMAWTQEWSWELDSAVKVGEEAEAKIRWVMPPIKTASRPPTATLTTATSATLDQPAELMEESTTLNADLVRDGEIEATGKPDPSSAEWVIFADAKSAYIMKDSLLAGFAGRNRRPLAAIKRGLTVGTPVVRGFDIEAWRKIHGDKYGLSAKMDADERQRITDLILVIHGIGQKLSERVESFHFTHAINGFRRLINVELRDPAVKPHLRKGVGIMILPVNWRSTVKFDVDGIASNTEEEDEDELEFSLEDITPPTIPAVRSLMGDVVMDIPYYLSHHKNKMVNAVIKEANRIYKLWCKNNPGFGSELGGGRVHLMAHSLGSAISLDILSAQPTNVFRASSRTSTPIPMQPEKDPNDDDASYMSVTPTTPGTFDFNTTNLFCAGSPAGLFMLINRRGLIPRYKLKTENPDSSDSSVCGLQGRYGCLAIENIYNVMHYSDPIAYQLNATVDPTYAASLKRALVPSTAGGFFSYLPRYSSSTVATAKPTLPTLPVRLPSNMELEVHDFSREELAERRMYLLNDCGQIDWYLKAGAGMLDSEYLNMLGAHSCYWESKDFVRFIVVECGRRKGRDGVVEGMQCEKKRELGGLLSKVGK